MNFKKNQIIRPKEGVKTSNGFDISELVKAQILNVRSKRSSYDYYTKYILEIKVLEGVIRAYNGSQVSTAIVHPVSFMLVEDQESSDSNNQEFSKPFPAFTPIKTDVLTLLAIQTSLAK